VFTCSSQECIEGVNNIDVHIGGNELHRICYNTSRPPWLAWSGGYDVPLSSTTLRGVKIHAAIAGAALNGKPAKQRDAMSHLLSKSRGRKGGEQTFKYEQVKLAIVISQEDIGECEKRKHNHDDSDMDDFTTGRTSFKVSLMSPFLCASLTMSLISEISEDACCLHFGVLGALQHLLMIPALSTVMPALSTVMPTPCKNPKTH